MEAVELERLLAKVGGKFKLVTLFQKRMRELQRGLPRLVQLDSADMWTNVSAEILQSKVDLIMGDEAEQMRKELALREAEELERAAKLPKPAPAAAEAAKPAEPAAPPVAPAP